MNQSGARPSRKVGQSIAKRPLQPFDCFRDLRTPPDGDPHYAVAIVVYELVAIIAVGTTKHITEPYFFEADETTRTLFGLPRNTRFLDCFVHAYWHGGTPVDICGGVDGRKQSPFKKAAERALVAHANGRLIPTIPSRSDLAALPHPEVADQFFVELYEIARRFAPTPTGGPGNTSTPPPQPKQADRRDDSADSPSQPKDDDGDGSP